MSESDAALRFDVLLDQLMHDGELPEDALGDTARTVQQLHALQRSLPSDAFRARLRASLTEEVPMSEVSQMNGHHPSVVVVPAVRMPVPPEARLAANRWLAIAAVLALLLGGMGAFVHDRWGNDVPAEPSAIPAAMVGTVEATPVQEIANWTLEPPAGATRLIMPGMVADGRAFTVFAGEGEAAVVQAVDIDTGIVLWSGPLGNWSNLLVATAGDGLLAATSDEDGHRLTAYDGRTGETRWSSELDQRPVALLVQDNQIMVLGSGNGLDAFDLGTRQPLWHADLSQYDDAAADDAGMNKYFNMTGSRLATTDGVVGAIVSNGRLVGVDADDGTVRWANDRTTNSATMVMVVDGKFVATAAGSDIQGYDYDGAAGTPLPATNRCQAVLGSRTASTPGAIRPNGAGVDSFEPATGVSPWGVEANRPAWIWSLDASNLIAMVSPGWDIVDDRPQNTFACKIDGATGAISDLDPNALVDVVFDGTFETPTGMAGFPNGGSFVIPGIDPGVAASLPHVGSGTGVASASWLQTVDGMTLIVLSDGTFVGMPTNTPSRSAKAAGTPEPDAVAPAEVAWTAPALDGRLLWLSGHAIDDERIYLGFDTNGTSPGIIRAVDVDTGADLWSVPADIKVRLMAQTGDLLLVGGMVLPQGQTEAVVALDASTGEERWRTEVSGLVASILVDGERALILTENNTLTALDLETGAGISTTNIGGRVKPNSSISYPGDHRLVIVDDTLIAVLSDGSVAGVERTTGVGAWWALRETPGETEVANIDGALIALAHGQQEGPFFGTPEPAPIASPMAGETPMAVSCASSVHIAPQSTTIDGGTLARGELMVMRLDPNTGLTIWNALSEQNYRLDFTSDAGILSSFISGSSWPSEAADIALCATDPETGRNETVERIADVVKHTYRLRSTSPADGQDYDVVGGFDGAGGWISLPAAIDPSVPGPIVEVDELITDGTVMLMSQEDAFYFVHEDGSVMKLVPWSNSLRLLDYDDGRFPHATSSG